MLKYIILFIAFTTICFGQNQKCELLFNDGTTIEGYGSLTNKDKIKFRLDRNSKPDTWDHTNVKRITFFGFENLKVTYQYVKMMFSTKRKLLEVVVDGEVKLLADVKSEWMSLGKPWNNTKIDATELFLIKHNEKELTPVNLGLFGNWKKKLLRYFEDCPEVTDGIKSGEYNRNNIKTLVEDYNIYCTE
ncbi:hypothetical protein [Kordia sp.]|uniref:hypothetical protein n=1 Tax=Kordia sp. TaxID=1965332 RepID=UPI003D284B1D